MPNIQTGLWAKLIEFKLQLDPHSFVSHHFVFWVSENGFIITAGPEFPSSGVGHCGSLTCSPGPHCCPGPSCPAAGRIPPYSASRPPGRLWVAGSGSSDWPVSCGSGTWWTDAACVEAGLVGEEVDLADWIDGHLEGKTSESEFAYSK